MSGDAHRLEEASRTSEVRALRARIEILEEENRQLFALLCPEIQFPPSWRLSGQRHRLLATLYGRRGLVTYEALRLALAGWDREVCESYVSVVAHKTRIRLAPFGIEICKVWGEGLYLPTESRRIIDDALAAVVVGKTA